MAERSSHTTSLPAEWTPHLRTLTSWPTLAGVDGRGPEALDAARKEVAAIANAIARFEPVWLYASSSEADHVRTVVVEGVTVKVADVDNLWIRDLGPVFVRSEGSSTVDTAIDFNFNYWGGKCEPTVDPTFARRILWADFPDIVRRSAGLISEGGALEVDGEGTLLVVDSSIQNANRNPEISRDAIEAELKSLLGVDTVIWLEGVSGLESTDWHVDAFARFAAPGHILISKPPLSAHHAILRIYDAALETFKNSVDARGRNFQVTVVPEPDQSELDGINGMVTSYVNYLLVGCIFKKRDRLDTS